MYTLTFYYPVCQWESRYFIAGKQRFAVISQGCVYCFKDEYAQKPISAFSLTVYER